MFRPKLCKDRPISVYRVLMCAQTSDNYSPMLKSRMRENAPFDIQFRTPFTGGGWRATPLPYLPPDGIRHFAPTAVRLTGTVPIKIQHN